MEHYVIEVQGGHFRLKRKKDGKDTVIVYRGQTVDGLLAELRAELGG